MYYDVVYSRRKSISISVSDNNKITVRCPNGTRKSVIEELVLKKANWINKVISQNEEKLGRMKSIRNFESVLVWGESRRLIIGAVSNEIDDFCVSLKNIKSVGKLFIKTYGNYFINKVKEISLKCEFKFAGLQIRDYKSRWACCTGDNNLKFGYKLMMLPEQLVDYVIIHELCHTLHHNHSKSFWMLVKKFVPDLKKLKSELNEYNFITRLY